MSYSELQTPHSVGQDRTVQTLNLGAFGRLLVMPGLAQLISPEGAILNFLYPTEKQINNIIKFLSK